MRQVILSRQDAEFGLLPPICIVCGRTSAQTQSVRLPAAAGGSGPRKPLLGLFGSLRRSLVLLVPVCSDHQGPKTFRANRGVRIAALSSDTVTLSGVAEAFASQWAAGASRRIAPAMPLQWADSGRPTGKARPSEIVTAVDLVDPADRGGRSLDEPVAAPPAAGRSRRPAGSRSSLWTLVAMVGIVTPLAIVSGILMLSVIGQPRPAGPRPAGAWPPPGVNPPPPVDRAVRDRNQIRGAEAFRHRRRLERQMREAEQRLIDRRDRND